MPSAETLLAVLKFDNAVSRAETDQEVIAAARKLIMTLTDRTIEARRLCADPRRAPCPECGRCENNVPAYPDMVPMCAVTGASLL